MFQSMFHQMRKHALNLNESSGLTPVLLMNSIRSNASYVIRLLFTCTNTDLVFLKMNKKSEVQTRHNMTQTGNN